MPLSSLRFTKPRARRRGASGLTYGLLVGLLAVFSISAVVNSGRSVNQLFCSVAERISGRAGCGPLAAGSGSGGGSGGRAGLYLQMTFEDGTLANSGFGTNTTATRYGSNSVSAARAFAGSRSFFNNASADGGNDQALEILLPDLTPSRNWEIRFRAWQDSQANTGKNFPTLLVFGINPGTPDSGWADNSYGNLRYGPSATQFAAGVGRNGSGAGVTLNSLVSPTNYVVDDQWVQISLRFNQGTMTLSINGAAVATQTGVNLTTYPFESPLLTLGHTVARQSDNGWEGFIDDIEVEIFDD